MRTLTVDEAKDAFDDILTNVKNMPIRIEENGKPIAVFISAEDYKAVEELKQQTLGR